MAWTYSLNIKGASGASGAQGASGIPGATGASGIPGASGASGLVGATGPAGTTTWSGITDKPAVIAAGVDAAAARNAIDAEYTGNKGAAGGYASLDSNGLVPSSQLPSFVDDVVEAASLAGFPGTGEAGKIYTALDTGKVYRWGGSSYVEISPSPGSTDAVPEGSTNLYYTAARADGRISAAVGSTVQAYSPTLTSWAGKSVPSGAVVGTTDSQAISNKTITGDLLPTTGYSSNLGNGTQPWNNFTSFNITALGSIVLNRTYSASSGTDVSTSINPTINQSGTAGYTALRVNATETATGSGTKRLIDTQVGGASRFSVDNAGNVALSGSVACSTSADLTIGTIHVGHASDTTISRSSAGVIAVEGVPVVTTTGGQNVTLGTVTPQSLNAASVGYTGMPANSQSAAYTLVAADAGKMVLHPSSDNAARTFTIPANSAVAFPIGTVVTFVNAINTVSIAITTDTLTLAGTSTTGTRTLAANGIATAIKVGATNWIISGAGLT